MPFEKGHPGRPMGLKNKINREVDALAQKTGCNPLEILFHFASGNSVALGMTLAITPDQRLQAASQAAKYVYPQRRAIEVNADIEYFSEKEEEEIEAIKAEFKRLKEDS